MFGRHRPKTEHKKRCSHRSKMETGSDMGTKSCGAKNCSSPKTK